MTRFWKLALVCVGALVMRLVLLTFVVHPGISDPNHYYNIGVQLARGNGYIVDYLWQFNNPPDTVVHPDDYNTPLTSYIAAAPMALMGSLNVHTALALFILIGSLLPIVGYGAAKQFRLSETTCLFVAASVAFLPEFVLNSVRTDTTIPNALLVCATILLLTHGLQTGKWWAFALSGAMAGLAYLNRNDSSLLLPAFVLTLALYALLRRRQWIPSIRWRYVALVPVVAALVFAPWILRNLTYSGSVATPNMERMFFFTDYRDHYVYNGVFNLETMLERQTPLQLIGKRLFEMAASIKLMYTTLDMFLPVAVAGGLILLFAARDRQRLIVLAPTLILLLGFFVFYTVLVPFKSQGGSFKKVYLTLVPLLLPLAGYALERAVTSHRLRAGAMALATVFLAANAFEFVRADARFAASYLSRIQAMAAVAETLPDANGDGEMVLMTQDPFMLSFVGIPSVLFPSDDRETVLEVAERYGVDYLLMPPDRLELDALYYRTETDPRFTPVADVPGTEYVFYAIAPNAGQSRDDSAAAS